MVFPVGNPVVLLRLLQILLHTPTVLIELSNAIIGIGEMAAVLSGKVDAIVLGGGLLRFDDMYEYINERCGWIAPVYSYPGEVEHEAMAAGALRVLRGEEEPLVYTGEPVFNGFDD